MSTGRGPKTWKRAPCVAAPECGFRRGLLRLPRHIQLEKGTVCRREEDDHMRATVKNCRRFVRTVDPL